MKVALVYDRVNKWGGAERILLALNKLYPEAPLYTSMANIKKAPWAKDFELKTSFLQKFSILGISHEKLAPIMPFSFESLSFDDFDLVISITSEAAKGIITKPDTKHICICLTPTRYLWSGHKFYFKNPVFRFITFPFVYHLRRWDKVAGARPDKMIAISKGVSRRIKKYYKRDSIVIFPPSGSLFSGSKTAKINEGDYFLVVSRLVQYKRIDLAIMAANKLKITLIIVGDGKERKRLEEISGDTVIFKGEVTDEELCAYYKNAKALIFPGDEDFGITVVEAQGFGKPVIAYKKGGALETIIEGVTGQFFDKQSVASLSRVLKTFESKKYNGKKCVANAMRFSDEVFASKMRKFVEDVFI